MLDEKLTVGEFDLNWPLSLPSADKLVLAVNPALASRVQTAVPDAREWASANDNWYRNHRADCGPCTAANRLTCIHFVSTPSTGTAFLEGRVTTFRPVRIAEIMPSVAPGGVSVLFGLLAAAGSVEGVNAALQLLWYWTGGVRGAADPMQTLKGDFIVSTLLQRHGEQGRLDGTSMKWLLAMVGLWDDAVVGFGGSGVGVGAVVDNDDDVVHVTAWSSRSHTPSPHAGTIAVTPTRSSASLAPTSPKQPPPQHHQQQQQSHGSSMSNLLHHFTSHSTSPPAVSASPATPPHGHAATTPSHAATTTPPHGGHASTAGSTHSSGGRHHHSGPSPPGVAGAPPSSSPPPSGVCGRGSGVVVVNTRALQYFLLADNLWLAMPPDAQVYFLTALLSATTCPSAAVSVFNLVQLRRCHVLQHLLFALLDPRSAGGVGVQDLMLAVIKVLLLDKAPHVTNLRHVTAFLSTTLSSQLRSIVTAQGSGSGGSGVRYHSDRELPPLSSGGGGGGASPAIAIARAHSYDGHTVVHVRVRLLELLAEVVRPFVVDPSAAPSQSYRLAMYPVVTLDWIGVFLDATGHLSSVTAGLRLYSALVPLYWPILMERMAGVSGVAVS